MQAPRLEKAMKYCPQCRQQYRDDTLRFCQADRHLLSLDPDPYNLVGRTLGNKYLIEALVGIGGMGAVYAAHHTRIDRQVAFKILQPNFALKHPAATEMFEAEARTAGRLKHENIVEVFDADRIENISYIAMEWLEGHTLEDELAAHGQLGFERAAWILRQIAAALDAAHAKRTIHRDLKPSNVMLVKLDKEVSGLISAKHRWSLNCLDCCWPLP
jgi:serine/threonine protein kinase